MICAFALAERHLSARRLRALLLFALAHPLPGAEFFVSPSGRDDAPGTAAQPVATLEAAQRLARGSGQLGREAITITVTPGTYYLSETLVLTPADSGTAAAPVTYRAAPGGPVVLSGGRRLTLTWRDGPDGLKVAPLPAGLVFDQLFVANIRQPMARYPNAQPGKPVFEAWSLAERNQPNPASDALAPARLARWSNPAGGFLHAMHAGLWGGMHWLITGKNPDGTLRQEGGWQNNRPQPMHGVFRFVENIREELDAPGEWFHDRTANLLLFIPPPGLDLARATIEIAGLPHLIELRGRERDPVRFVQIEGFTFRHTARSFMQNKEPLLRSDWTTYRGAALVFAGTEDCAVRDADFDHVGGNAVAVTNYNRRVRVTGCRIEGAGANGVLFVGNPAAVRSPLFDIRARVDYAALDRTPGPIGHDYPMDCSVEDCLIARTGRVEKQTAPVQISMSRRITVRACSIYGVPRAGLNISEGTWGGHLVEDCDIFDTVLETGDHGSFNSWGRDRYWCSTVTEVDRQVAREPSLPLLDAFEPTTLRHNRWRCDHGWDIDLDDGSSNYVIENNLLLHGGLKLREGFRRVVTNNIILNNSLHPHCWYAASGDVFRHNLVMGAYKPAGGMPVEQWGREIDRNFFASSQRDRARFARHGCDVHSIVADPGFVDPTRGDFRVRPDSPALALGFRNFPMDGFGVRSPRLRALHRTPVIPTVTIKLDHAEPAVTPLTCIWRGARLRDLEGEEYSAYGVGRDAGGVLLAEIWNKNHPAVREGFQPGDLIQTVAGQPVRHLADMIRVLRAAPLGRDVAIGVVRAQAPVTIVIKGGAEPPKI